MTDTCTTTKHWLIQSVSSVHALVTSIRLYYIYTALQTGKSPKLNLV